jgi:hypothetical protein
MSGPTVPAMPGMSRGDGRMVGDPAFRATIYHNRAAWDMGVPGDAQGWDIRDTVPARRTG